MKIGAVENVRRQLIFSANYLHLSSMLNNICYGSSEHNAIEQLEYRKNRLNESYFTCGRKLIFIHTLQICSPIWVKFGVRHLHIMLRILDFVRPYL
jgi:hypothetical protein